MIKVLMIYFVVIKGRRPRTSHDSTRQNTPFSNRAKSAPGCGRKYKSEIPDIVVKEADGFRGGFTSAASTFRASSGSSKPASDASFKTRISTWKNTK